MQLTINGEPFTDARDGWSVADLLAHLRIEPARVAVELNRDIVPKQGYGDRRLRDGDELEILQFVGGGSGRPSHPWRTESPARNRGKRVRHACTQR